eukprot:g31448.t1
MADGEKRRHAVHHVGMSQRGNILVVLAPSADTVAGSFESFAESEQLVPFMRDALSVVESELGLTSYHLRLLPWSAITSDESLTLLLFSEGAEAVAEQGQRCGFVVYVAGNNGVVRYIPVIDGMDRLDAPINYQDAEGKEARRSPVGRRGTGRARRGTTWVSVW